MRFHVASAVRSPALRRRCFSLAKTCSIGLRSGRSCQGSSGAAVGKQAEGVGRPEQQSGADAADRLADGGSLVAGEIVHDHDGAERERRHEELLNPSGEALAVDRLVEHAWSIDAVASQPRNLLSMAQSNSARSRSLC